MSICRFTLLSMDGIVIVLVQQCIMEIASGIYIVSLVKSTTTTSIIPNDGSQDTNKERETFEAQDVFCNKSQRKLNVLSIFIFD